MSRRVLLLSALLAASACGGGAVPRPADQDLVRARATWPDTTRDELERGRDLYVGRCSGCHPLHAPNNYPAGTWQTVVGKMAERARLNPAEQDLVLRYLVALSARR